MSHLTPGVYCHNSCVKSIDKNQCNCSVPLDVVVDAGCHLNCHRIGHKMGFT